MRIIDRNQLVSASPIDLDELEAHLRVDSTEAAHVVAYAAAAAIEIERYANIALLNTEVTAETGTDAYASITLPIGPLGTGGIDSVDRVNLDGSLTPVTEFSVTGGLHPRITFATPIGGPIRVVWMAGYGVESDDVPADLRHAVMDHAMRLYDWRGDTDVPPKLAASAARICARYRRVLVAA